MGVCYVANAPRTFVALWAIAKGFLDEHTRSKVRILSVSATTEALLQDIPAQNLPSFLGGDCTCHESEGGCMHSNAGPWQDFNLVNKRIVHKTAAAALPIASGEEESKTNFNGHRLQTCEVYIEDENGNLEIEMSPSGRLKPIVPPVPVS